MPSDCICSKLRFLDRGDGILSGGDDSLFVIGVRVGGWFPDMEDMVLMAEDGV